MIIAGKTVLTANNLGNQGPVINDPPYIEYSELQDLIPEDVVLRVSNLTEYLPSFNPGGGVNFNGLSGNFGQINVRSDWDVDLKFEFLNKTTGDPVVLDSFAITWFDFDTNPNGFRIEKLIVEKTFEQYAVPDPDVVLVIDGADEIEFQATIPGTVADNPTDPDNLTPEQMSKSVGIMYANISSFCVTLCIGGPMNMFGRNLIFSGLSDVFMNPSPPPIMAQPGAVIRSDPHFQGLDGNYFDFTGQPDNVYALLVHADDEIALIARFGAAYTTGITHKDNILLSYKRKGTWVSSIAYSLSVPSAESEKDTVTLLVSASSKGLASHSDLNLEHGSMQLIGSSENVYNELGVRVTTQGLNTVITFTSRLLDGSITIVPPPASWGVEESLVDSLTHLNVAIDRLSTSDIESLDGVIGVSARGLLPGEVREEDADFEAIHFVDEALVAQLP